jgi:outer membrane protein
MKKNFLSAAAFFVLFSFSASAIEVGVLDVDKIVKESKAMRHIQKVVSGKQDSYQQEVTKKQDELEKEQKAIEAKKNILSEEAFEKKAKEFEAKVDELKTFVDNKQNSLRKASLDSMGKVNDKIKEIITEISQEKGLDIIIPSTQALYYKESLDISNEVLIRLNKSLTEVKVKFE